MATVNIRPTTPDEPGSYRIEVDGRDVSNLVRGARIDLAPYERPEVELDLIPRQFSITLGAVSNVVVDYATRVLLESLGWTPPAGDRG